MVEVREGLYTATGVDIVLVTESEQRNKNSSKINFISVNPINVLATKRLNTNKDIYIKCYGVWHFANGNVGRSKFRHKYNCLMVHTCY